jgi:hypothetical protein
MCEENAAGGRPRRPRCPACPRARPTASALAIRGSLPARPQLSRHPLGSPQRTTVRARAIRSVYPWTTDCWQFAFADGAFSLSFALSSQPPPRLRSSGRRFPPQLRFRSRCSQQRWCSFLWPAVDSVCSSSPFSRSRVPAVAASSSFRGTAFSIRFPISPTHVPIAGFPFGVKNPLPDEGPMDGRDSPRSLPLPASWRRRYASDSEERDTDYVESFLRI